MNSGKINIDVELDNLREEDYIFPDDNFNEILISKLKKTKRNKEYKIIPLVLVLIVLNILLAISWINHHNIEEKENNLNSLIINFSLDR